MLACAGMITADKFHPLFGGKLSANPLLAFTQVGPPPHPTPPPSSRGENQRPHACAFKQMLTRTRVCTHRVGWAQRRLLSLLHKLVHRSRLSPPPSLRPPPPLQVPKLGLIQIFIFIGFMEVFGILNSRRADYEPGNFLGTSQWETGETWDNYQLRELNNGTPNLNPSHDPPPYPAPTPPPLPPIYPPSYPPATPLPPPPIPPLATPPIPPPYPPLPLGRLAMFGAIGMLTGSYITGLGPLEALDAGKGGIVF